MKREDRMDQRVAKPYLDMTPDRVSAPTLAANQRRDAAAPPSILFAQPDDPRPGESVAEPAFFADLNCDQIVQAVVAGREEYDLVPLFRTSLHSHAAIAYRHAVMQDLEQAALHDCVATFAATLRGMRRHLDRSRTCVPFQKETVFLECIETYCAAVATLAADLTAAAPRSQGLRDILRYLADYCQSDAFTALRAQASEIRAGLDAIGYCVLVKGDAVTVRKYAGESDYSRKIEHDFLKFKQGAVTDYLVRFPATDDMNHVEAQILACVAKLYPEVFDRLTRYCLAHADYVDATIAMFDREVQFYLAYLDYIRPLRQAGLQFCYPEMSPDDAEIFNRDGFDVALAHKLVGQGTRVVCNDFSLSGAERLLVISGPNQGGKTTFARAFGQMHFLASLGCPVPGTAAKLRLFDHLFTHFEKQERVENLRGKLEDDLIRMHGILDRATGRSIIVMNEIFTSTTIRDEIFLSRKIMDRLIRLGVAGAWVTFVDELSRYGPQTVSMVSTVVADDPTLRTFRIVRQPADGLAYAMALARKHGLTRAAIMERIRP
jgi:hypothetical protein